MQKNIRLHALTYGSAMLLTGTAHALTLQDAINEALNTSPAVEKAKSATLEAKWKKVENYSGFLPTVSANANYLFDKKYALTNVRLGNATTDTIVPQIVPNSQLTLTGTYPLFEGFSSVNRYQAASESYNAAANEEKWNNFKTEMDVTLAYYKALANKILKDVAAQNLKALQDHLKDVKLFKQSGMATNYDVLRVEVQVSNAESDLLNADDNIAISEHNLLEILGKDSGAVDVSGDLPVLDENLMKSITTADIHNRNDIQALKERVNALSYADKAQDSFWVPRIAAFGQYQYLSLIHI